MDIILKEATDSTHSDLAGNAFAMPQLLACLWSAHGLQAMLSRKKMHGGEFVIPDVSKLSCLGVTQSNEQVPQLHVNACRKSFLKLRAQDFMAPTDESQETS